MSSNPEGYYIFPASYTQKRLWFLDELLPNTPAYTLSFPLRIRGQLNEDALKQSLQQMVHRHESLRTFFTYDDGQLMQVVIPEMELSIPIWHKEDLSDAERDEQALKLAHQDALKPFVLSKGPLIRASIVRFAEDDHVLLLSIHHIIFDGWSGNVFFRELEEGYRSLCLNEPIELGELEIQYGDYAVWQREWVESVEFQAQLSYWKERLKGYSPLLEIPTDRPRLNKPNLKGRSYEFEIPPSVAKQLAELGREQGTTPFMTYLTAFQLFLFRYSGQDDFCIGSLHANRNLDGVEGVIGFFVNTLVHRAQIKQGVTFRERLQQVVQECIEVLSYADVPFDKIVEEVCTERNLHHTPLVQVLFECQNKLISGEPFHLLDTEIEQIDTQSTTSKFDLSLYIHPSEEAVSGMFEYNSDLFDDQTIKRMTEHFLLLLERMVDSPDQEVEGISLLTENEWLRFERECNRVVEKNASFSCIHTWFEDQVERSPDAIAVVYEKESITYGELNRRANQVAHDLHSRGVEKENLVGIWLDRSIEMIVAILGVLKAGAAYVPIDPSAPSERAAYILDDANISVLLTANGIIPNLAPQLEIEVIDLSDRMKLESFPVENPDYDVSSENVAYVIYTSGSTGKPKGVMVEHGNIHRLFTSTERWYHFAEHDVWTLFHSYAFDFSVWEIWGALLYGGKLVVVPYEMTRSPESFYRLLTEQKVTVLNQTPSSFRQLIQVDQMQSSSHLSLRYVIFGGEALDFRTLSPWFERHGDVRPQLINMYGITETTVHVTYRPICHQDARGLGGSYIGVPISDLQVYILDPHLQPVPTGVFGEMYVEGAGLTRGYLNRPELTAERFITHPFHNDPKRRLYKTGDLARRLPNGELDYRGRADSQVKIRGFRMELGEIEAAFLMHPSVAEAVVAVKRFPGGQEGLVGYVCQAPSLQEEIQKDQLRSFLAEKLPEYMIPAIIMVVERIPLTVNGKIDLRALPGPDFGRMTRTHTYIPPESEEERIMTEIWEHVLQVERVGVEDNYFELGGDSIRSLQVLYQAREEGIHFAMQDLFKYRTVRSIVKAWKQRDQIKEESLDMNEQMEIEDAYQKQGDIEDAYPMSQSQIGMIYHSQLDATHDLYHNVHSFHLQAPYCEQAWKKAIEELVSRHPILRTSFDLVHSSQPMQCVHRHVEVPLCFFDLRSFTQGEQEERINHSIEHERNQPFHWTEAPIIRFSIHRRNEDTFQLVITEHHAVLDGWSVATMQSELFSLYLYHLGLAEPLSSAPSTKYKDFIALEQKAIRSDSSKHFWKQQLSEHHDNRLPRLLAQEKIASGADMKYENVPISSNLSQQLKELSLRLQVPIKSVLLAAHLRVISFLCNQKGITTGVVWNGRPEQKDSERALGMFLNTLPFCVSLEDETWSDLIRRVFDQEQEILPHRHYPLAQIQRDRLGQPLFETFFNFTSFYVLQEMEQSPYIKVLDECSHADTNFTFGVEFSIDPVTSDVHLHLRFDGRQFPSEQIERFAGHYQTALHQMANQPESRYFTTHLLSEEERNKWIEDWNDTGRDYPVCSLPELFEEQVRKTPDRTALYFEGTEWTYQQLNMQVNKIAHILKKQGVQDNVKVGLFFERSLELVASIYGIGKAGGAYVPFDPETPSERLTFLFEDADILILITQRKWLDSLPPTSAPILIVEEILAAQTESDVPATGPSHPDCMAYMIYTSGSTGKPKGVMIAHRSIHNRLMWMQEQYSLTPEDRVLQKTPYSFDVSVWEFFWPLITGASLVIARPGGHKDPHYVADLIESTNITTLHFVPSMLSLFVEEASPDKCLSMKRVFCSGEALSYPLQQKFFERFPAELHNLYGPTEATVDVTYWKCCSDAEWAVVPIGRPVANTQAYILDDQLQPLPLGTPGELFIGGVQVGSGYHNRDELTAERFIPNPFRTGERMYKTGDLVRLLPDGNMEYLGRNDDQVKIRGLRIELGEIESVLGEHPAAHESIVMTQQSGDSESYLVAYLIADRAKKAEIEEFLTSKLPTYMIPYLIFLDRFPITHNGKLDRKALANLKTDRHHSQEPNLVEPRDELEAELVSIWEEILGRSPISVQDDFLGLGGHSIAAVRLMSRINKRFHTELPLSVLLRKTTIQGLAARIRQGESSLESVSPLVSFNSSEHGKASLFLIHPIGGSVFCYTGLAAHLESDFTVYAFQSISFDGTHEPQTSVEEMAKTYLQVMRTVQKQGPYYLGGWSFGGVIAYEMVNQLQQQGEDVACLLLLDSYAPMGSEPQTDWTEDELIHSFIQDLLYTTTSSEVTQLTQSNPSSKSLFTRLQEQGNVPQDLDEQRVQRLYRIFQANVRADESYIPKPGCQVSALLIRAQQETSQEDDNNNPTLGWHQLIQPPIQVVTLPSNHYTILQDPHVKALAETVQQCINKRRT
ncbi:amino acid adenylation domain-containing protein [Baia soyae]|uniref:Amino acid adenylation domain-containing protein n=1 Tax=Baia soyae TaxID=1544746 RepID=A0A4R2RRW3_9BACL|nr:non-ribosomal peptide synthetase [Baia soyae]TCP66053.1 amino acid adenylation domain-containing protein [Baia soyae]